ncbi:MAG: hypothetical protein PHQ75_07105, partial [Thermoguttaceae bacterium]|nr:hypothetical protein [Thermoguttaceae bacterium]
GMMGTAKEVPALEPFLKSKERALVDAAAMALGKIPGPEATAVLKKNESIPAVKAALIGRNAPLPPLDPNETAMPIGLSHASQTAYDQYMTKYDSMSEPDKIRSLAAATARQDKRFRQKALAACAQASPELQLAGLLALEKLATKDDIDLLLGKLATNRELIIRLCGFIVADGFDEALRARLVKASDTQQFLALAEILASRGTDVRPEIFARTTAAECPDRLELMQQAARIATKDDVPNFVASTVLIPRGKLHDAAENLIAACCNRDAAPLIALIGKYPHAVIYPILARTGGTAAEKELSQSLKSTDPALLETALHSLSQWSDARFHKQMFEIAMSDKYPEGMKRAMLRAYIRVISLPDDKIGVSMSRDDKLAKLKDAFTVAKDNSDKSLVLSRLAANRTDKSLAFAVECAADPTLAEAAYRAIVEHAHDTILRKAYPEAMLKAINLVIANSKDAKLIDRAKLYKGRM